MMEMRWRIHDTKDGAPPFGAVCIGERVYQVLQYRQQIPTDECAPESWPWADWQDVKAGG